MNQSGNLILLQLLAAAAYYDCRIRKVPNAVIVAGLLMGIVLRISAVCEAFSVFSVRYAPGVSAGLFSSGLFTACLSALAGYALRFLGVLLVLAPVFRSFGAGAGDLKLVALMSAFLGVRSCAFVLLPGLLGALGWHLLGVRETPLALALFLGALPVLSGFAG